jgi:hypothetical protein
MPGTCCGARRLAYDLAVRRSTFLIFLVLMAIAPAAQAALPLPIAPPPTPAVPIPSAPASPAFTGAPATPHPVRGIAPIPRNRFMAPNGTSEIHDDAWQTDAYTWAGPLGRSPVVSSTLVNHDCGSITFDAQGHLVSVCVGLAGPELYMFDPNTLATLATFTLPPRQSLPSDPTSIFQDFTGGGYFYLDSGDRVVTSTTTRHILVIADTGTGFEQVADHDLSGVLTSSEQITSALPDSHGLLWFVAKTDGVVGTLNLATGAVHVTRLGHGSVGEIENSFAADQHGAVYIATDLRLYRFTAGSGGVPRVTWSVKYPNSGKAKPGQVDAGTGTTPTVMQGGYVNITDNADPLDVVVYRTAVHPRRPRLVCTVPVFHRGASDTENSLMVAGRSILVENNYGYTGPTRTENGGVTAPGVARVDINANGRGCHTVWTNTTDAAPTVVSKLSEATGLVYTYTKGAGSSDPWYFTAIDFRTGREVYRQLAGTGLGYNNNYAGIAVAPDGDEYLGTLDGVVALRDG